MVTSQTSSLCSLPATAPDHKLRIQPFFIKKTNKRFILMNLYSLLWFNLREKPQNILPSNNRHVLGRFHNFYFIFFGKFPDISLTACPCPLLNVSSSFIHYCISIRRSPDIRHCILNVGVPLLFLVWHTIPHFSGIWQNK